MERRGVLGRQASETDGPAIALPVEQMLLLLQQPETGMGYQRVVATLRDGRKRRATVYNAEWLV